MNFPPVRALVAGLIALAAFSLLALPDSEAADFEGVAGTWKWATTNQNGQATEFALKLKVDGGKVAGVLVGRNGNETAIEDGKVKEGEVAFKITRERNGQKTVSKYQGKINEEGILKGTVETDRDGQVRSRKWEAKREGGAKAAATGLWKWGFTRNNGEVADLKVRLQQEKDKVTGNFIWMDGSELPISEGKIKEDEISFKVITDRDGRATTSKFHGKISGDGIKGKVDSDFSGEAKTYDWEPKRVKE